MIDSIGNGTFLVMMIACLIAGGGIFWAGFWVGWKSREECIELEKNSHEDVIKKEHPLGMWRDRIK